MENRNILLAGFIGGSVTAIFSSIPYLNFINCFCCIGIMLGGVTALLFYNQLSAAMNNISMPLAITIGMTAGLMGAFLSLLLSWIVYLQFGHWDIRLLQSMAEHMEEVPQQLAEALQLLEDRAAGGFDWAPTLFSNLLMFPLFCLLGSLLTRFFLNKKTAAGTDTRQE
jgi:uncharacterized protein involved in cysteine biosynthesis